MSDDLISREEALQVLEDVFGEYRMSWGREYGGFGAAAQEVIEELPTAFDKEKVIEELEYDKEMSAKYSTGLRKQGHIEAFDEAISIVKRAVLTIFYCK